MQLYVTASALGQDLSAVAVDFSAEVVATAAGQALVLSYATFIAIASAGALGVAEVTRRLLWEVIDDSQVADWQNINAAQSVTWGSIDSSQGTSWQTLDTAQSTTWGTIDNNTPDTWSDIPTLD